MRLRNNGPDVGPTSLLQILIREMEKGRTDTITDWGDGEGKVGDRKDRKKQELCKVGIVPLHAVPMVWGKSAGGEQQQHGRP